MTEETLVGVEGRVLQARTANEKAQRQEEEQAEVSEGGAVNRNGSTTRG